MKMFLNLTKVAALIAMVFVFSSCLKNQGNYQRFSNLTGSMIDNKGLLLLAIDGGGLIYSEELQKYKKDERLLVSFKIDYDNQPSGTSYYTATEVSSEKFDLKTALNVSSISNDTLKNDTILGVNAYFISEYNDNFLLTISTTYFASNDYHRMYIARYQERQTNSDTLKLEFRHNALNDGEKTKTKMNLTSFNISQFLYDLPEGSSRVVEVKLNTFGGRFYRKVTNKPNSSIN